MWRLCISLHSEPFGPMFSFTAETLIARRSCRRAAVYFASIFKTIHGVEFRALRNSRLEPARRTTSIVLHQSRQEWSAPVVWSAPVRSGQLPDLVTFHLCLGFPLFACCNTVFSFERVSVHYIDRNGDLCPSCDLKNIAIWKNV